MGDNLGFLFLGYVHGLFHIITKTMERGVVARCSGMHGVCRLTPPLAGTVRCTQYCSIMNGEGCGYILCTEDVEDVEECRYYDLSSVMRFRRRWLDLTRYYFGIILLKGRPAGVVDRHLLSVVPRADIHHGWMG